MATRGPCPTDRKDDTGVPLFAIPGNIPPTQSIFGWFETCSCTDLRRVFPGARWISWEAAGLTGIGQAQLNCVYQMLWHKSVGGRPKTLPMNASATTQCVIKQDWQPSSQARNSPWPTHPGPVSELHRRRDERSSDRHGPSHQGSRQRPAMGWDEGVATPLPDEALKIVARERTRRTRLPSQCRVAGYRLVRDRRKRRSISVR